MTNPKKNTTVKKEKIQLTDEDKILGITEEIKEKTYFNYESKDVVYKVTNRQNGRTMNCTGFTIETFIGNDNKDVREKLTSGEKKVTVYKKDEEGNTPLYDIEVID